VQADPIKPRLKPPGTKRLKLKCDTLLSTSAFKFNLRCYIMAYGVLIYNYLGRAGRIPLATSSNALSTLVFLVKWHPMTW
jgi:hypothetical protein